MEVLRPKRRRVVVLPILLLAVTAAVLVTTSAIAQPGAQTFTIGSNLDRKTVLPHRIRWIAYPSAPVSYPGVEFLIDGKVVFDDRLPPFAFGSDGHDEATGSVRTGYLVTSWLRPGLHRFTVRARGQGANRNRTVTKTFVARVVAPPLPPRELRGTWQRELSSAVAPDKNALYREVTAQPGTYRIEIDQRFLRASGPQARKHLKIDYGAGAATIAIGGPVWTGDPDEGAWCEPWGPAATYAWSVSAGTLTLTALGRPDACKQRGAILAGEWTRVR